MLKTLQWLPLVIRIESKLLVTLPSKALCVLLPGLMQL